MLDLGFVRDHLDLVRQKMRERGLADSLGDFENFDRERRKVLAEVESRKARRNKISDEIAALKKHKADASGLIAQMKELGKEIDQLDQKAEAFDNDLRLLLQNVPDLPAAADTLAWAYYHKGVYRSAVDLLEEAVKKAPQDGNIHYHLAMAYNKLGEYARAKAEFEQTLRLNPKPERTTEIRQLLAQLSRH